MELEAQLVESMVESSRMSVLTLSSFLPSSHCTNVPGVSTSLFLKDSYLDCKAETLTCFRCYIVLFLEPYICNFFDSVRAPLSAEGNLVQNYEHQRSPPMLTVATQVCLIGSDIKSFDGGDLGTFECFWSEFLFELQLLTWGLICSRLPCSILRGKRQIFQISMNSAYVLRLNLKYTQVGCGTNNTQLPDFRFDEAATCVIYS